MYRVCGVVAVVLLLALSIVAQEFADDIRTKPYAVDTLAKVNSASVMFDKLFDSYRWNAGINYRKQLGAVSLHINEQFRSSLIRTNRNLIRDEQLLNLEVQHKWGSNLFGTGKVSSFILSDDKNIGIQSASSHAFYGGVGYIPFERITLIPLVGLRFDNQIGTKDKGPSYHLNIIADGLDISGYRTTLNGTAQYDKLTPRTLETYSNILSIERNFFEKTQNLFQVQYSRTRRDFYIAADTTLKRHFAISNNINTRMEEVLTFSNALDYKAARMLVFRFEGKILMRDIERNLRYRAVSQSTAAMFNTNINELRIDGAAEAQYSTRKLSTAVQFLYQERDEKHGIQREEHFSLFLIDSASRMEERKNNYSKRSLLGVNLGLALTNSDSIVFSGTSSLLRYDTPSLLNDDDRDELFYILSLTTLHRFSRYLRGQFTAEANLMHLVYLNASRSANNTWNRIFRLSPRMEYSPSNGISTVNTFEVLANYTVYDFEFPGAQTQSHVFRQFGFIDSTTIELTNRIGFEWYSYIRLYERGELYWKEFTEKPLNYFEDKTFIGTLSCRFTLRLLLSCGIRYFSQSRFQYIGSEKALEFFLRSIGPLTKIQWDVSSRTQFLLKGWYERLSQTGQSTNSIANMTMTLSMTL